MKRADFALSFANTRLLATLYYGLLSVVGTILINGFLTILGVKEIVPLFQSILLGMVVASAMGSLFGEAIIHCPKPYKLKTFLLGFLMVIVSLPFFDLGLLLFMNQTENQLLTLTNTHNIIAAYFMILIYSYLLFGFLLAIASGIASVYLRHKLVYHILHTDRRRSHRLPRFVAVKSKPHAALHKTHAIHRKKN